MFGWWLLFCYQHEQVTYWIVAKGSCLNIISHTDAKTTANLLNPRQTKTYKYYKPRLNAMSPNNHKPSFLHKGFLKQLKIFTDLNKPLYPIIYINAPIYGNPPVG